MAKKFSENETKPSEIKALEWMVMGLKKDAEVSEGKCSMCGKEGKLLSGVCEKCFIRWAAETAIAQRRRIR